MMDWNEIYRNTDHVVTERANEQVQVSRETARLALAAIINQGIAIGPRHNFNAAAYELEKVLND